LRWSPRGLHEYRRLLLFPQTNGVQGGYKEGRIIMESGQEFRRARQTAIWICVAAIVIVASLFVISLAFGRFSSTIYPPFFFFGWWIFIPLFFFAFFFRWWGGGYWWGSRRYYYDPSLETLRQRFARGEITKEQYEEMRKDLEK
jgi:putative membrane protein